MEREETNKTKGLFRAQRIQLLAFTDKKLNATELKMTISPIDLYPYDSQTHPVTINSIF